MAAARSDGGAEEATAGRRKRPRPPPTPRPSRTPPTHPLPFSCRRRLQLLPAEAEWTAAEAEWHPLGLDTAELSLERTLLSGMSFRWARVCSCGRGDAAEAGDGTHLVGCREPALGDGSPVFCGTVGAAASVLLRRCGGSHHFAVLPPAGGGGAAPAWAVRAALLQHLSARVQRAPLDAGWARASRPFSDRLPLFPGVRVLAVPALEAVVTFAGSANNTIKRNAGMVAALVRRFPENLLGDGGGVLPEGGEAGLLAASLYAFPTLQQLAQLDEADFWALGWGYRSPRMPRLVQALLRLGGAAWLERLRRADTGAARGALQALPGVGRKVADCVLLFGLGRHDVVVCDTHCFQMARRYGLLPRAAASIGAAVHDRVAERFRALFGPSAGWAFMLLFVAEVHPFRRAAAHLPSTYPQPTDAP